MTAFVMLSAAKNLNFQYKRNLSFAQNDKKNKFLLMFFYFNHFFYL